MAEITSAPAASVLNEILSGDALGVGAAARLFPAYRGDRPHSRPATVWRWINHGTRTADGRTVKLEAARVGGRWLTSRAAIARFSAALTPPTETKQPIPAPSPRSEAVRRRACEAAVKRLVDDGA
ncbi:MAG: DUF1580 domain-containing protein [Planctomycetes bacterium]|nr:DUF1580 domain-containing protein [Planctomycetota bacterium]